MQMVEGEKFDHLHLSDGSTVRLKMEGNMLNGNLVFHRTYKARYTGDGEVVEKEFAAIDGERFGAPFDENHPGYDTATALLIVNRWNYVNALQGATRFWIYYVPTVEGAA